MDLQVKIFNASRKDLIAEGEAIEELLAKLHWAKTGSGTNFGQSFAENYRELVFDRKINEIL